LISLISDNKRQFAPLRLRHASTCRHKRDHPDHPTYRRKQSLKHLGMSEKWRPMP
jgi:hypothetical protein